MAISLTQGSSAALRASSEICPWASLGIGSIDGTNNDSTTLGGAYFSSPTADGLALYVTTAATQADSGPVLARVDAPLAIASAPYETRPQGPYGSPAEFLAPTGWTPVTFDWQNPGIPSGTNISWRIKLCDVKHNCDMTDVRSFQVLDTFSDLKIAMSASPDPVPLDRNTTYSITATITGREAVL